MCTSDHHLRLVGLALPVLAINVLFTSPHQNAPYTPGQASNCASPQADSRSLPSMVVPLLHALVPLIPLLHSSFHLCLLAPRPGKFITTKGKRVSRTPRDKQNFVRSKDSIQISTRPVESTTRHKTKQKKGTTPSRQRLKDQPSHIRYPAPRSVIPRPVVIRCRRLRSAESNSRRNETNKKLCQGECRRSSSLRTDDVGPEAREVEAGLQKCRLRDRPLAQ